MVRIPRENTIDSGLALLREGFRFIPNRRRKLKTDIFQTRLMGRRVICMGGEEAARLFYDPERFQRKGAVPKRVQHTLMGEHGVQTLDGEAHRHRKEMFMSLMGPDSIRLLMEGIGREWELALREWERRDEIVLFPESQKVLCKAACAWAGVPLEEEEAGKRAADFGAMVDAFGGMGLRFQKGKLARKRTEEWIREVVGQVRAGTLSPPPETALSVMTTHRDLEGSPLHDQLVTVELMNVIRPIVAIATYITFGAVAFTHNPESRLKYKVAEDNYREWFVQEVRRFYPFGPFLGAIVRREFFWRKMRFPKGRLVLLDIYGTNHDRQLWKWPDIFFPERFRDRKENAYDFIPQGGGDHHAGHRCAGEWITIEAMKVAMNFLIERMTFEVPPQDLSYDLSRMPTFPQSGFIMRGVRGV